MLSDLAVFTEYTYEAATQVVAQQVTLFNEAARGTFILASADHSGDFSDRAKWQRFNGLIRRRNAYGAGNIPQINMTMVTDTMVKIATGTPEVRMDPSQFNWIKANPEQAGAALGQQLGEDMVRDMFNTGLSGLLSSHLQVASLVVDKTASAGGMQMAYFNAAQTKFGDHYTAIQAWVMHSGALFSLFEQSLANVDRLYNFAGVQVQTDPFGRAFIVSDAPALVVPNGGGAGVPYYYTLGCVPGAVQVDQNADFVDNWDTKNGQENIVRTYQAEWSYNLGIKGFSWDKANGGKSPTDAALMSAPNWDRVAGYNDRDLGGVIIKTK